MLTVLSQKAGLGYGCPKTIQEWRTLRRRPGTSSSEWSAAAIVGDDHAFDCARYEIDAEMREARARAARFRVNTHHTGALTGVVSRRLHVA
jgi:hypothetical protein